MQIRYLILIASDVDYVRALADKVERSGEFRRAIEVDGTIALVSVGGDIVKSDGGRSLVLGTVFGRRSTQRGIVSDSRTDKLGARWSEEVLIRDFWGSYVSVAVGPQPEGTRVFRDPTGGLPCYYVDAPGVTLIGSDVAVLVATGAFAPEVDWSLLAWHLQASDLRTSRTGLRGLTELLPGVELCVRAASSSLRVLWTPWNFAADLKSIDLDDAAIELRKTIQDCTADWASRFRHVLLGVSGGLDSSIIATCLAGKVPKLSCYTLVAADPMGDERRYAHPLAEAVGAELFEMTFDLGLVEIERSSAAHLPRPVGRSLVQEIDRIKLQLESKLAVDAFFSGAGGDNVFCSMRDATPTIDRILAHGLGPGMWRSIGDLAQLTDCTLWEAISLTAHKFFRARTPYRWVPDARYLSPKVANVDWPEMQHDWLQAPSKALPGKIDHIAMIMRVQNYVEGSPVGSKAVSIHPLLSQPIIELCLQLPTWMWSEGGRDRAIARRAFAGVLPDVIAERRSKGSPTGFSVQVLNKNRDRLRKFLTDGILASHNIIEIAAVSAVLDDPAQSRMSDLVRLLTLADAEAWCRSWSGMESLSARPVVAHA